MSLISSVKSAVKNTASKVTSTVSNLAKQASALVSGLGGSQQASAASALKSTVPNKSTVPVSSGVAYSNGVPVKSTVSPGSSIANPVKSSVPTSSGHGVAYDSTGRAVASTVSPGSSIAGSNRSSGGGSSNPLSSAYNALQGAIGGNDSTSYADYGTPDSYKGTPGTSSSVFSPGQGASLEAQAQGRDDTAAGVQTSQTKERLNQTVNDAAKTRQTQLADLQAQLATKQAELKSSQDATAVADDVYDPDKQDNLIKINDQVTALEKAMENANKETPEEVQAKTALDKITADEAAVNAGLTEKVTEVNKEAIPQGFLSGWGTTFNKDANSKLTTLAANKIPLTQQLATAQAKRQAAMDVVKTKLADAKESRTRATDIYQTNYTTKNKKKETAATNRYKTIGDGTQLYDTVTGKVIAENSKSYAPSSGSKSSNSGPSQSEINAGEAKLRASKGSDGYVDPTVYQTAYNEWPGTTASFLAKFPPKAYVNPANSWLPAVLRPASTGSSRSI